MEWSSRKCQDQFQPTMNGITLHRALALGWTGTHDWQQSQAQTPLFLQGTQAYICRWCHQSHGFWKHQHIMWLFSASIWSSPVFPDQVIRLLKWAHSDRSLGLAVSHSKLIVNLVPIAAGSSATSFDCLTVVCSQTASMPLQLRNVLEGAGKHSLVRTCDMLTVLGVWYDHGFPPWVICTPCTLYYQWQHTLHQSVQSCSGGLRARYATLSWPLRLKNGQNAPPQHYGISGSDMADVGQIWCIQAEGISRSESSTAGPALTIAQP